MFGGLQEQDNAILTAFGIGGFVARYIRGASAAICFQRPQIPNLVRGPYRWSFFSFSFPSRVRSSIIIPQRIDRCDSCRLWTYVENYPFSFVLVTAFTMVNGLFFYLMRAPTALGRPIMDQLAGFRLYLETAESGRLNMNAPEITADRFEALLPYAVALDVEKPWSDAFAAAVRRAHPGDADPMSSYQPSWSSGGGWSGGNFGERGFVVDGEHERRPRQRSAGLVRLVGLFRRGRRLRRRRRRGRRRGLVRLRARVTAAGHLARQTAPDLIPSVANMPDLLLELLSEEIPARMQARAADDLRKLVTDRLVEEGLTYEGASAFATPRRLALTVHGHSGKAAGRKGRKKRPTRRRAGKRRSPAF